MMSHTIWYVLLLMFLSSEEVLLVKASDNIMMQEIHGKQAKDLEELCLN